MASPKISLKLLVDTKGPRVLFAEVPKEFVDFLFNIFSLPLSTLIEILGSKQMVGSLGKLKDSIQSFHENYLQPGIKMEDIFNHKTAFNVDTVPLSCEDQSGVSKTVYRCVNATRHCYNCKSCCGSNATMYVNSICPDCSNSMYFPMSIVMPKEAVETKEEDMKVHSGASKAVYRCSNATSHCYEYNNHCASYTTLYENSICPHCSISMNVPMTLVIPKEVAEAKKDDEKKKGGYVKEVVTYMVMDDLVVTPMSTISSIMLISKFGVKDLSQVEEKTVTFGKDEVLVLSVVF
ncbi:hypothetical protein HanXRQr2_Chr08g0332151 [Helianthus annuus]|uniref:DUF674 domain-containing protein n=1 Tax=Helianthus annuus TaxID=4232 RepID=A0A251U496_HELAN|nr:hypothetical protein HanXRQr2_Chr08g0332151 [Helianthus annuus]KAJ0718700.1 hypothetical protein HanLR1_Chr08g0273471 [Helianthus annuus]